MVVEFLGKFNKDLDKITLVQTKQAILKTILLVEQSNYLSEIPNVKKLSGHKSAFRIKLGDYRIGVFLENGIVEFARVAHRKDIYKIFP